MPAKSTYSAGTAFLTVVPSFRGIEDAFKSQVRDMAKAADKDIASGMARGLKEAQKQARGAGAQAGKDFSGAYQEQARKGLDAAWKALPEPQPDVKMRKWNKALAQVRADMKELSTLRLGIDIDRHSFDAAIEQFHDKLVDLRDSASGINRDIDFYNADQAAKSLHELAKFTDSVNRQAADMGDQAGTAFNQRMQKVLGEGLERIAPFRINADSTEAERKITELYQRMLVLKAQRIGIDIDAATAFAQLREIHQELERLDRTNVRVDIRTNAHDAATGMGAFIQQAEQAGRSTEGIGHRANFSMSRLEYLIALGASLGTVIVPAALAAAGAVGTIGTAAAAVGAGIGVFALGISGVAGAVQALNKYENDQEKSSNSLNQAQRRLAGSAGQVRMAELSLANARRTIAEQEEDAARRVADAEQNLSDARRQARLDIVDAGRAVRDAQRAVTDAEEDAVDVRESLNEALRQAARDIAALDVALARNNVDQQKAVTAQKKALEEIQALRDNPRAHEVELREAKDAYDEQTVRLLELRQKQKELTEDKQRADKLGVEGDKQVIQARERVANADERVARAKEKLSREQEQRREVEYRASRRVSDAQRQVADAQRQQTRQALDGQFQLAQATNAVEQAKRSEQQSWEKAGIAGGEALDNLNWEMKHLSPAAQHFARFIHGLKDEMLGLRASAAEPLLPRLEEAIKLLLPYLPPLEKFIGKVATKVGDLAVESAQAFGSPVWQRFFGYIDKTAVPALDMMFQVGSNLTEGLISLFLALTPFNGQVGGGLIALSEDFAAWAERLNKTKGYQDFLIYVRENGPRVVELLGEVGHLFIDLVKASMPIGEVVLRGLTMLFDLINSVPTPVLSAFVLAIAGVSAGMLALGAVMRVQKIRQQLTDIFGQRAQRLVQTYAVETGRATDKTSRFGKATATIQGIAQATGTRVAGMASSVGTFGAKAATAVTATGPLRRGLDNVRGAAYSAATVLNGPGGVAAAAQVAGQRIGGLASQAGSAATGGLARIRQAAYEVAAAANGPGGLAAGVQTAGGKAKAFGTTIGGVATTLKTKMIGGLSSATAFLGGPWGAALAGATLAIGYFTAKSAEQKGKVDALAGALSALNGEYTDLKNEGKSAGDAAAEAFANAVKTNPELQTAVVTMNNLGVSFEDLVKASTGGDPSAVISAIDEEMRRLNDEMRTPGNFFQIFDNQDRSNRIDELGAMKDAFLKNAKAIGLNSEAQKLLNEADDRSAAITAIKNTNQGKGLDIQRNLIGVYDQNAKRIDELEGLVKAFGTAEGNAALRADALKQAIEGQTGAAKDANERAESWNGALLTLKETVDANGTSLHMNSREGLANRDAIQAAAKAAQELYLEEIKAGGELPKVTKKHGERIAALKEEAKRLGLAEDETNDLINKYGEVPKDVKTIYDTDGFDKVYKELERLHFMQEMIKKGVTGKDAEAEWKHRQSDQNRASHLGWAEGGPVRGPGTTTSDSIIGRLSNDEHVWTAAEVKAAGGHDEVIRMRQAVLGAGHHHLPGWATGGPVRRSQQWPIQVKVPTPKTLTLEEALSVAMDEAGLGEGFTGSPSGGALGGAGGGMGWRWQMAVLRAVFPGLNLISGFRANSYTGSGQLSWHSRNGGRAVDIPPRQDVFNWIHDTYGKRTKELIWGGDPGRGIFEGRHYRFSDLLLSQHGPYRGRPGPSPHIHWAFDQGGQLLPGWNMVPNFTGRPEPVLSPQQWTAMENFVRHNLAGGGRGDTYQLSYADSTLTPERFADIQRRAAVKDRIDRDNY